VFWLKEERVVSADWVVSYKKRLLQLQRQSRHDAPARSRVTVRENERGELAITYRGRPLRFSEIAGRPECTIPPRWTFSQPSLETKLQANANTDSTSSLTNNQGTFLMVGRWGHLWSNTPGNRP
jgi:hypothetical protein